METLVRPDLASLVIHLVVTLLFAGVFAFLHRQSHHVYFQYWAVAWVLLSAALLSELAWALEGRTVFLLPAGLLQLAFAASLIFAGGAVSSRFEIGVGSAAVVAPAVAAVAYGAGVLGGFRDSLAWLSLLLAGIYGGNFLAYWRVWSAGPAAGGRLFSTALALGAVLGLHDAVFRAVVVGPHLRYQHLYYLALHVLLAFSALLMWMEAQNEQLRQTNEELAHSRQQIAQRAQLDPLTGLLNRAALNETCEANQPVAGVVAVLDLDNFKDINDALGHLAGDEVLASVGGLIRASIRRTDQAWRWGGDEFVILFLDQPAATAQERIQGLEQRLQRFRIRGKGVLPVNLSWGTAAVGGSLREAIEEADQQMYLKKKEKASSLKFFGG